MNLTFQRTPDLIALAEHAIAHHRWQRNPYEETQPKEPALMLVKDQGVYLMSPFTSKDAPESARLKDGKRMAVVYAEDYGPDCDYIGGDDFGENVEGLPALILQATGPITLKVEEQERFDARNTMSDDVNDLRVELQNTQADLAAALAEVEKNASVIDSTRALATKSMDEIRVAMGKPIGSEDKSLNRAVDYVRELVARAERAEAEVEKLRELLFKWEIKADAFDYLAWLESRRIEESGLKTGDHDFLVMASDGTTCWANTYLEAVRIAEQHDRWLVDGDAARAKGAT